jgi:hypothetical protein
VPGEDNDEKDDSLADALEEDVLSHFPGNNVLVPSVWWSLEELVSRFFSGECERSERVHDEIDPEELNSLKWGLPEDDGADEGSDEGDDVDCELELEEASDVVEDVSAPFACLDD